MARRPGLTIRMGHRIMNLDRRARISDHSPGTEIGLEARGAFLEELCQCGLLGRSAQKAGHTPGTFRGLIDNDPAFKELVLEALDVYRDLLQDEAHRRAVEGVDEPVFYQGQQVGKVRKFSDRLLELMLQAHVPEKFRKQLQVDARVSGGVVVMPAAAPVSPGQQGLTQSDWMGRYREAQKAQDALTLEAQVVPTPEGAKPAPLRPDPPPSTSRG